MDPLSTPARSIDKKRANEKLHFCAVWISNSNIFVLILAATCGENFLHTKYK